MSVVLVAIYVMSVRVVWNGVIGGGHGVEAVLRVGGGVAMSEMSFLTKRQVGFGSSREGTAMGKRKLECKGDACFCK